MASGSGELASVISSCSVSVPPATIAPWENRPHNRLADLASRPHAAN